MDHKVSGIKAKAPENLSQVWTFFDTPQCILENLPCHLEIRPTSMLQRV